MVKKTTFAERIARLARAEPVRHVLSSQHIRKMSNAGLAHPEAVSPKGVYELCHAIVSRNAQDDDEKTDDEKRVETDHPGVAHSDVATKDDAD